MPTIWDIAIGLTILMIKEDARLRRERIRFCLEVFVAFRNRAVRNRLVLIEDPFATFPLRREQIYPEGASAHVN